MQKYGFTMELGIFEKDHLAKPKNKDLNFGLNETPLSYWGELFNRSSFIDLLLIHVSLFFRSGSRELIY